MELMTEEQLDRYEAFRRSAIDKLKIKRVCTCLLISWHALLDNWFVQVLQTITGHNVSVPMVTVVRGMAKVFVGELVEAGEMSAVAFHTSYKANSGLLPAARLVAHEQGDLGPLQPAHYRAAYQQLNVQGKVPHRSAPKRIRL